MPKYLILIITVLTCLSSFAQKASIKGTVVDESGQGMPGVTVRNLNSVSEGTSTFVDGTYSINVTPGTVILSFSFIGSNTVTDTLTVEANQDYTKNVKLIQGVDLGPAEVFGDGDRTGPMERLDPAVATQIPSTRGTV